MYAVPETCSRMRQQAFTVMMMAIERARPCLRGGGAMLQGGAVGACGDSPADRLVDEVAEGSEAVAQRRCGRPVARRHQKRSCKCCVKGTGTTST